MPRLGLAALLALALITPAHVAFPGSDGGIVSEGDRALGAGRTGPAVSADGRWIAFSQGGDIWVAHRDGRSARRVTKAAANDSAPAFAPDGRHLVFSRASVGEGDLFVVGTDGRGLRNVSNDPDRIDDAPDWSPDGRRIAFAGDPCTTGGPTAPQGGPCVFVMNADGSGKANLTPEEYRDECDPSHQNAGYSHAHHSDDPSWSPDGRRIAFTGYFDICKQSSDGAPDIWVMNADGTAKTDLMSDTGTPDEQPAFSPSGQSIVFASDRSGTGLFTGPAGGGAVARLSSGALRNPYWGTVAKPCRVPSLKGRTVAAARRALEAAGCGAGKVRGKGRVVRSRPAAGRRVPAWTKVALQAARR